LWEWVVIVRDSVVVGCKCAINPITNPNPVYSHLTRDSINCFHCFGP
jgi:hypothetical protein